MGLTVDAVIATYLKLRDKKAAIEAEAKERADAITAKMQKLETYIKETADAQGVTSFKTPHGTAFLKTDDYASVADWDSLLAHILSTGSFDMFEKRVSKTAVRGYIEENKAVPPGVNYGTRLKVLVRQPTKRAD